MVAHQNLLVACFVSLLLSINVRAEEEVSPEQNLKELIEWLLWNDGIFHPKLEIRRANPSDATSRFAMFSTGEIEKDELLIMIPEECLLTDQGTEEYFEEEEYAEIMQCGTVFNLIEEMELGDGSNYAPYVNYIHSQGVGQAPFSWSKAGQDLFKQVKGVHLPPHALLDFMEDEWFSCGMSDNPLFKIASIPVMQRSWDDILIPVYDMMSHRNGHWLNTKCESVQEGDVEVLASRHIKAGEELYVSYNQCEDCGGRVDSFGTDEILFYYGFVEQYPRRWILGNVAFDLDEKKGSSTGELEVNWLINKPSEEGISSLAKELQRLRDLGGNKSDLSNGVPKNESDTIWQYHEALIVALEHAIADVTGDNYEKCVGTENICSTSKVKV